MTGAHPSPARAPHLSPPSAAAPWVMPLSRDDEYFGPWNALTGVVARCQVRTPVTAEVDAQGWGDAMRAALTQVERGEWDWPPGREVPPSAVCKAILVIEGGLALPDLFEVAPAFSRRRERFPNGAARGLAMTAEMFGGCTLRDMIGWLLVGLADPDVEPFAESDLFERWMRAGFAPGAWVYPAAGLSPAEARAGLRSGTLTPQRAHLMAVLRGMALPVT